MPPFDIFSQLVGKLASSFSTGNPAWDELVRGFARLSEHASSRWASVAGSGIRCTTNHRPPGGDVEVCSSPAIAACIACGQPVCFSHAYLNVTGEVVCGTCIHTKLLEGKPNARAGQAPPPAPTEDRVALRKAHLKTLRLRGKPTQDQIKSAYRKLASAAHPDKHPDDQVAANARFIELGKAKDWLLEDLKRNP